MVNEPGKFTQEEITSNKKYTYKMLDCIINEMHVRTIL